MELGMPLKSFLALMMGVLIVVASVFWIDDRPDTLTWILRAATSGGALALLGIILYLHVRWDQEPDYLGQLSNHYFNRDGFAFIPVAVSHDGVCWLRLIFQNQRDRVCIGRARFRPAPGFFLNRNNVSEVAFEVFCRPASFGIAEVPIGIEERYQGTKQSFEIGASVEHLEGKGTLVRFADGIDIEVDERLKRSGLSRFIAVAAFLIGHRIVTQKPATAAILIPTGVHAEPPRDATQQTQTLWQAGDPPLGKGWQDQLL